MRVFLYMAVLLHLASNGVAQLVDGGEDALEVVTVAPRTIAVVPGSSTPVAVTYSIPEEQYQNRVSDFFGFSVDGTGFSVGEITYPQGRLKDGRYVYQGEVTLSAPLSADRSIEPGSYDVVLVAEYQFCNEEGVCFIPQRESHPIIVEVTDAGAEGTAGGTSAAGTDSARTDRSGAARTTSGRSVLVFLLMAFVGGLLLNIMPCVLPVLSLKALSLVKQSGEHPRELRVGGILYTGGIVASLTALAVVVIALKLAGERVGWGFQFQNPAFIVALAAIILVFALSLFEVFTITAPGMNRAARLSGKGGRAGSFFSGVFAVLLATPCTAPFLGSALGFAFSQPPVVILSVFVLIGLGLALPFLLLGFFPRLIRLIPKPGPWMNRFRELMAFLLLGTVVWLLSVLRRQIGGEQLIGVIAFFFSTAAATWVFGWLSAPIHSRRTRILGVVLSIAIVVGAGFLFLDLSVPSAAATDGESTGSHTLEGWESFSPETVAEIVATEQPVFVAFGAAWCLTCKTNEATVLRTDRAERIFAAGGVRRFYGDFTAGNPDIAEWIEMLGRAGVPLYAFYPAGVDSVEDATLLPEILTHETLERALPSEQADNRDEATSTAAPVEGRGEAAAWPETFEYEEAEPLQSE